MKRIRCFFLKKKLVGYLYGEITPYEKQLLESHIGICPSCRKTLEEIESVAKKTEDVFKPDISEASLETYSQKVLTRISEKKVLREIFGRKTLVKKGLVFAASVIFIGVILYNTRIYLIEKEIERMPELYQNLEVIWNLDLIKSMAEDESFISNVLNQNMSEESEIPQYSRKEIHFLVHHFKHLPDFERDVILTNYQQWINYSSLTKKAHQEVYYYLKKIDHPDLKRIILK